MNTLTYQCVIKHQSQPNLSPTLSSAMEKIRSAFYNLFSQINITFSKDSSDCIATLSSAAECIQFLVSLPEPPPPPPDTADEGATAPLERTYTMSLPEVRELLGWNSEDHPLLDLDMLLCVSCRDRDGYRHSCIHTKMS